MHDLTPHSATLDTPPNAAAPPPPESPKPPEPPGSPPINYDLACVGCRYNLRGLTEQSTCPECGAAVADTLTHFKARWSADQIRTWRRGCQWLGWSGVMTAAIPVLLLIVSMGGLYFYNAELTLFFVVMACIAVEYALWAAGCWTISGQHPGETLVGPPTLKTIRWLGVSLLAVVIPIIVFATLSTFDYRQGAEYVMGLGVCVALALRFINVLLLGRLMSRTLGAAGNVWKRRNLIVSSWVVMLLCAAQFLATALLLISQGALEDTLVGISMALGIPSIFALPFIAAWASVACFRAAAAFRVP